MPAPKRTDETKTAIKLLGEGVPGTDVAKALGKTPAAIYSIKRHYKDEIDKALTIKNTIDITKYESDINVILKRNILRMGNTILNKDISKSSIDQLARTFGIMFDKLRLIEGKSTQNVATQVLHNLNPEQLEIIKDSIRSLKESMLKNDE